MDKRVTSREAIDLLEDGMTIGIGGWGPRRKPMALIRQILRSRLKDLTVVSYGGPDVGMLCAAGKVKKLIYAFVSLDAIPLEPYFRLARQKKDIEVMEIDEGMMMLGLKAAAMGSPFIPTKVGLGTDVICHNKELKVIASPYDDKEWVAMPALICDASLIHVERASADGVAEISGPDHYMDDLFARAAKRTIVSCEEVVDKEYFWQSDRSRNVYFERSATSKVVELPLGAHPTSCPPMYGPDFDHLKAYGASAKEGGFEAYKGVYLKGSEKDYLESVGGEGYIKKLPPIVY